MANRWISLLLAPLLMGSIGVCASAEVGVTDKEITIATCNPLSGPSARAGHETITGIMALINSVNDQGGVNGRKIHVVNHDDKYEAEVALAEMPKILNEGVFMLAGLYGSALLARVYIPSATSNKLPIMGFHSGPIFVSEPPKRYVFGVRASYRDEMKTTVDNLWKHGIRNIGIIYQNDSYGADMLEGLKTALQAHGSQLTVAAPYTRNSNNLAEAFDAVRKAKPQAVVLAAVYTPCAQAVKLAREANWSPIFIMNSGTSVDLFIEEAGKDADGKLFTEVFPPPEQTDLPLIANYRKSLLKYFPKEHPGFVSLRGYMDACMIVEGLKRAGKDLTREKFVDAMEHIHHLDVGLGKSMEATYTVTDHLGFHKVFMGAIKDGATVPLTDWREYTQAASR